jgi:hypothetical protein
MSGQHSIIFVGPTIPVAEARRIYAAEYLPPVAQGDLYRAARRRPAMIGIIDGTFERTPAVWHKEILWALSQGIHVLGSSSMGALRAAELAPFGMEGVGEIYVAFQAGELVDDDEVAVIHADAEHQHLPLSVAMVNIRATLSQATRIGILDAEVAAALADLAKRRFYPERSYPQLLQDARTHAVAPEQVAALERWLPHGQIDQKRADAIAMLVIMHDRSVGEIHAKQVQFHFEHTSYWERVMRQQHHEQTETERKQS